MYSVDQEDRSAVIDVFWADIKVSELADRKCCCSSDERVDERAEPLSSLASESNQTSPSSCKEGSADFSSGGLHGSCLGGIIVVEKKERKVKDQK